MPELHRLGQLVLGQRGKVRKLDVDLEDPGFALQLLCLRLAVALCHARRDPDTEGLQLQVKGNRFLLAARRGWAAGYPNRPTCCAKKCWPGRRPHGSWWQNCRDLKIKTV